MLTPKKTQSRKTVLAPLALLLASGCMWLQAQGMPAMSVGYTEARAYSLQRQIQLSGTVRSHTDSTVAAEVAGLVEELLAQEGQRVEKGRPLLRLRTRELGIGLQRTKADLAEARARLAQAELSFNRNENLFSQKIISQQQLDDASAEQAAWRGRVASLEAGLAKAELDLERATVRAPFTAVIIEKQTEPGQWVGVGSPVFRMAAIDDLEVRVDVPERYFPGLETGTPATVTFESLPGLTYSGHIQAIIPQAGATRTLPVKIRFRNDGGAIPSGILAHVKFTVGDSRQATIVPKDAVVSQGPQRLIYVLDESQAAQAVPVQMGDAVGSWIEVTGGVTPGQKVITLGNERLMPGQVVKAEARSYELP